MMSTSARQWRTRSTVSPDSPDEMAFGQLRAPISVVRSNPYAGSSSRILTDPTGERRNRQLRQRFRGLRSCLPNPSGGSGTKYLVKQLDRLRLPRPELTKKPWTGGPPLGNVEWLT